MTIAIWLYCDSVVAGRGGRRSERFRRWNPLGRWIANLLPIRMIKDTDIDPKNNYIFCVHPHGNVSLLSTILSDATGFSSKFPGLKPHMVVMESLFRFPVLKHFFSLSGAISSSADSIDHVLRRGSGNAVVIAVGGGHELIDMHPGTMVLTLRKRKGFVKMALKHGASLVPVLNFGDGDLLQQIPNPPGSLWRSIQDIVYKLIHRYAAPVTLHGRQYGFLANRVPCFTVVGAPIHVHKDTNPSPDKIEALHSRYMTGLQDLFHKYKSEYSMNPYLELDIRY
ncbi:2-acylglycerol O-acyltransferase 1-like [Tubulanus polymorphus]|uniref:2-acylglycerol O-acyltransferase 1-like n=1 Tax=Tubulanus polymorphus TaxID=672921 RepID=UPI003DA45E63